MYQEILSNVTNYLSLLAHINLDLNQTDYYASLFFCVQYYFTFCCKRTTLLLYRRCVPVKRGFLPSIIVCHLINSTVLHEKDYMQLHLIWTCLLLNGNPRQLSF